MCCLSKTRYLFNPGLYLPRNASNLFFGFMYSEEDLPEPNTKAFQSQLEKNFLSASWLKISPNLETSISPNKKIQQPRNKAAQLSTTQSSHSIIKTLSAAVLLLTADQAPALGDNGCSTHITSGRFGGPSLLASVEMTTFHLSHHLKAQGETLVDTTGKRNQLS